MNVEDLTLELRGAQTGVSLFEKEKYIATYKSSFECILDIIYRWGIGDVASLLKRFNSQSFNGYHMEPFIYRGVCTEMYWPTDTIFNYVYYANSLSELFENFTFHEERALRNEERFYYGPQGTGIHLFNKENNRYEFWLGGKEIKTVSDVMQEVRKKGLQCPTALVDEYKLVGDYDVFISHKSTCFKSVKTIYDFLKDKGLSVFLSEITLPAISNADYIDEINKALDHSKNMVVFANSATDISCGWIKYEWSSFINEKLSGRKEGNIITVFDSSVSINELPYSLRNFEVVQFSEFETILPFFTNYSTSDI